GRIVMKQDRIGRPVAPRRAAAVDPARRGEVPSAVARIEDDSLRDALDRLGVAVVAKIGP
ncbi:hypothetical protein LNK20_21190, partial [Bacillus safensis]|uniref:hypothetical protein n=1 Tax=Bacillus safensis TaxID=561879 RepID=UPI001FFC1C07